MSRRLATFHVLQDSIAELPDYLSDDNEIGDWGERKVPGGGVENSKEKFIEACTGPRVPKYTPPPHQCSEQIS